MDNKNQAEQGEPDEQDQTGFRYRGTTARYRRQKLPNYKGNPLIEALRSILKEEEITPLLRYDPGYDEQYRQWASELRLHLILDALRFVEPLTNHIALQQLLDGLLRSGYVERNPFPRKAHLLKNRARLERMKECLGSLPPPQSTGREVSIIGLSGVGKSTALRSILALYDQVINHSRYRDQPFTLRQLVYMKLECPQDGSLGGLCKAFSFDTNFEKRAVLSYGTIWETRLRELWFDQTVSLKEISRRLGMSEVGLKWHAIELHLPLTRVISRTMASSSQTVNIEQNCSWYRNRWLEKLKEHREENIGKLQERTPLVYKWLLHNDRQWLNAHLQSRKIQGGLKIC